MVMKKVLIFDFDGTLTSKESNSWKDIWDLLGHDTKPGSIFSSLFVHFINGEITYEEWVNLDCGYFIEKDFSEELLYRVSKKVKILDGLDEFLEALTKNNFEIHIVSGNLKQIIELALGKNKKYFTSIQANELVFDYNGNLLRIKATPYDWEGKAVFVEEIIKKRKVDPKDIYFVGNSSNDEFVSRTGCNTICINPDKYASSDKEIWGHTVNPLTNFNELLPVLNLDTETKTR